MKVKKEEGLNLIKGESKYLSENKTLSHHVGWNNIKVLDE